METLPLFDDVIVDAPKTEGIKYAGSKQKLLPHILFLIRKVKPRTVLDGFAGTTRVSQALAQSGYTVVANDLAVWSEVFATCYLLNEYPRSHYVPLIEHLNHLPPEEGWFTENYGSDPGNGSSTEADGLKKPWQRHNTRRLDAIRNEIDRLDLTSVERSVLLTSLIYALDEVDSTLGHFASYLNEWSPRSYKPLRLKLPAILPKRAAHEVQRKDIFDLLPNVEVDLAYVDPPTGPTMKKCRPLEFATPLITTFGQPFVLTIDRRSLGKPNVELTPPISSHLPFLKSSDETSMAISSRLMQSGEC